MFTQTYLFKPVGFPFYAHSLCFDVTDLPTYLPRSLHPISFAHHFIPSQTLLFLSRKGRPQLDRKTHFTAIAHFMTMMSCYKHYHRLIYLPTLKSWTLWPTFKRKATSVTRTGDFYTLGNFSKPGVTIILPKSPKYLRHFCKGVKSFILLDKHFWPTLSTFGYFLLVTLKATKNVSVWISICSINVRKLTTFF